MRILELNREFARREYENFIDNYDENFFESLSKDYLEIRNNLLSLHRNCLNFRDYEYDLNFGIQLYEYFNNEEWFNECVASNYGFWKFICIKVVPDIVQWRHGNNASYYYEKNVRIYIPTLWWYIHLSYQNNIEDTKKCLSNLNTDYILQLVERPGKDGTYIEVSREIIRRISSLSKEERNKKIGNVNLFRRLLIQNTAKVNNYNLVFENNVEKYVNDLLISCNVKVK